jgi:hypothetical protein
MIRYIRNGSWLTVLVAFTLVASVAAFARTGPKKGSDDPPATQPDDSDVPKSEPGFHSAKTIKGDSKMTGKPIKFQVGSKNWRMHLKADLDRSGGGSSGNIRVALMLATRLDGKGVPVNWQQVEIVSDGKVPAEVTKEFSNGLDQNGKPQWLGLSIVGNTSTYEVTIEDQSPQKQKKSKKKKD